MTRVLPSIKDKFDVDSASEIVVIGYPENQSALTELISWSCFPNDPVCFVTFPYIASLRNEVLAPALAEFLDFHVEHAQMDLVADAFWLFINERGATFRSSIAALCKQTNTKTLFDEAKYSLEQYAADRLKFDAIKRRQTEGETSAPTEAS